MAKRPKPEEIVAKLRQADVLISHAEVERLLTKPFSARRLAHWFRNIVAPTNPERRKRE